MRFDSDGKLLVSGTPSGSGGTTDMTPTNQKLDEIKAYVDELEGLMPTVPLQNNRVATLSSSTVRQFRDDFPGTTLDSTKWDILQTGAGQSISVSGSELTINSGTNANSETIIRSKATYNLPCRIMAIAKLSQRIANQEFYLEFVDSTGQDFASWQFFATNNQTAHYTTGSAGDTSNYSALVTSLATNNYQIFESELFAEECYFYTRPTDTTGARGSGIGVRSRKIPDSNLNYYIQIRVKNLATAPASTTSFTLDSIGIVDIERLSTEIIGGRGGGAGNLAIPVAFSSTPTVVVTPGNTTNPLTIADGQSTNTETAITVAVNTTFTSSNRDTLINSGSGASRNLVRGLVTTDAPGTLIIEQSQNNTTWRQTHSFAITGNATISTLFEFKIVLRYFRVKYSNGATAQTMLEVVTTMFNFGA